MNFLPISLRSRTARWFVPLFVLASLARPALAADEAPPAGRRVFYTGHSFHMFVPRLVEQMVKEARIADHQLVGTQGIGGSTVTRHWDKPDAENTAKAALRSGKVDVFTMAAHLMIPDPGIDHFVALGLEHNPKLRLLVQGSWFPFDVPYFDKLIRDNRQRDEMKIEDLRTAMQPWREKLEAQVDAVNRKYGRRVLFIVPAGEAVVRLRELVVAGKFPGITKQSELFRDPIGHANEHVMALCAYCNYAAIYHRSPVGLKLDLPKVDAAQNAILQQIAWDVVSEYPYAGIAPVRDAQ